MNTLPSLSRKEALILEMLIHGQKREMYGLEMVENSDGHLKRGTIYVTLQRLSEKGYVTSREELPISPQIGIARRLYSITGLGEAVFKAHQEAAQTFAQLVLN
jgi:DNA-binding PadR family transcriptional regulator